MILLLDIEHRKSLQEPAQRAKHDQLFEDRRRQFQELSGRPCVVLHYSEFRSDHFASPEVTALIVSWNWTAWHEYDFGSDFDQLRLAIQQQRKPVLGICGGHQLIGLLLGGEAEALPRLRAGEVDIHPVYAPGFAKEWGYYKVSVTDDPIFAGLSSAIIVKQMHFWQLTKLPPSFVSIARNEACSVQGMRHPNRPLYGMQFHPELYDADHPDGRILLRNFFSLSAPDSTDLGVAAR